jgi:hypothetical protein
MKYLTLIFFILLLTSCVDDRGCWEWESQQECDERLNPPPENAAIGVYRCQSNQVSLDQSRMPLINAGLDVKLSYCADLFIAVEEGAEACPGNEFTQVDIHFVPYESRFDAISVNDFEYRILPSWQYTVKECT